MALCKFFQQGYCRYGASCRYEHPSANANPFSSNTNRFSALSAGGGHGNNYKPQDNPYKLTKDIIKLDLADDRPRWILSSYGPGKDAPEQLFGGYPREQSLEEVMMYIRASGNEQQAMSEVTGLYQQAEQQIQTTLNNLDGAMQFILAAENKHPNRIDICKQGTLQGGTTGVFARDAVGRGNGFPNPLTSTTNPFGSAPQQSQNPFGGGGGGSSSSGTPAFGQPSSLGQKPNPFGSASSTPAFGQPSAMGAPKPAFGQPSQMGAAAPAFGQPSTLGQKPNPFGSAGASGPSGFGQAAAPSTFGQPSALGQRPNPFGAAASGPSPFSQAATAAAAPPSAPNPFGQPSAPNPFAKAASAPAADQSMDTSAPAPSAANNPFGKPSGSPFGAQSSNGFGAQPQPPSGFGAAAINPFARTNTQTQAQAQAQAPAAPASKNNNPYAPDSTKQHPPPESYIVKTINGQMTAFNGQPVQYRWKVKDKYEERPPPDNKERPMPGTRNADGSWRKIFFPDGPPAYNKDTEPDAALYNADVKAAYAAMTSTGRFVGDMPEIPPMREDCVWNF
ncbi:hypothetical protein GGR53DRAFT_373859 [Hypoxylon sp. FL1150]|nr:hypothetical protein GGR53DRAFT_373859 [Hypoxylon sp. FL1150]